MKVAILAANWFLHSNVCYAAAYLSKKDVLVDVFLYNADEPWTEGLLDSVPGVSVYRLNSSVEASANGNNAKAESATGLRRIYNTLPPKLRDWTRFAYDCLFWKIDPEFGLIPQSVVSTVLDKARRESYSFLIGIEKGGLIWAGAVARIAAIPMVYYSLELFTRDHTWFAGPRQKRVKTIEEKYHKQCALTVVQDERRGRALLSDNGIAQSMKIAYMPVSSSGPCCVKPSVWLHEKLGLDQSKIIVLCFGHILPERLCVEIACMAQHFAEDWLLVFHGYGRTDFIEQIRSMDSKRRVAFSVGFVPPAQIQEVISSAKIGLAIYPKEPINDRLTGLSSEKIALYLKGGLPIIAFRYESYEHIQAERAGVLVDEMSEIPAAISEILAHYHFYQCNALTCYTKHYCFEANFQSVMKAMQCLNTNRTGSPSQVP